MGYFCTSPRLFLEDFQLKTKLLLREWSFWFVEKFYDFLNLSHVRNIIPRWSQLASILVCHQSHQWSDKAQIYSMPASASMKALLPTWAISNRLVDKYLLLNEWLALLIFCLPHLVFKHLSSRRSIWIRTVFLKEATNIHSPRMMTDNEAEPSWFAQSCLTSPSIRTLETDYMEREVRTYRDREQIKRRDTTKRGLHRERRRNIHREETHTERRLEKEETIWKKNCHGEGRWGI